MVRYYNSINDEKFEASICNKKEFKNTLGFLKKPFPIKVNL